MTVSTRTPEGLPSHCPLCGAETRLEYSEPSGDAPCPSCGYLLWRSTELLAAFQQKLLEYLNVDPGRVTASTSFANDLGADSLDLVEFVMEMEEDFRVAIPQVDAEAIETIGDLIRYVEKRRRDGEKE